MQFLCLLILLFLALYLKVCHALLKKTFALHLSWC